MRKLKTYLALGLLLISSGLQKLSAQSDSQTLHSPFASIVGIAEFDFGLPMGSRVGYPLSLGGNLIGGYQINKLFTVGLGLGLQGYGPSDVVFLPVFVDGRMHFPQKKWTPYIAIDMGYAFSIDTAAHGGFLINPSVGARVPLTNNLAFGFGLGLRVQQNQGKVDGAFQDFLPSYFSVKAGVVMKLPRLSRRVFKQTMHRMKDKEKRGN